MTPRSPLLLIVGLITLACAPRTSAGPSPADPEGHRVVVHEDLSYTLPPGHDTRHATLDLHRVDDDIVRPLAVLMHGGSWVSGDKSAFAMYAPAFIPWWIDRGYAVATVNVRLASPMGQRQTVTPIDQVHDLAHALAWLDEQSDRLHLRADATVLVGYSSGAHLVALLAADARFLDAVGQSTDQLAASISLDVHAYDVPYALELMVDSEVEQNMPLIRHLFGQTEEMQRVASPITYADTAVPPTMLVSVGPHTETPGTHGYIVSRAAARYASALTDAGRQVSTWHDPTETHATLATGFGAEGDATTMAVADFLDGLPD